MIDDTMLEAEEKIANVGRLLLAGVLAEHPVAVFEEEEIVGVPAAVEGARGGMEGLDALDLGGEPGFVGEAVFAAPLSATVMRFNKEESLTMNRLP